MKLKINVNFYWSILFFLIVSILNRLCMVFIEIGQHLNVALGRLVAGQLVGRFLIFSLKQLYPSNSLRNRKSVYFWATLFSKIKLFSHTILKSDRKILFIKFNWKQDIIGFHYQLILISIMSLYSTHPSNPILVRSKSKLKVIQDSRENFIAPSHKTSIVLYKWI